MIKDFSSQNQIVDERNNLFLKAFPASKWKINDWIRILPFGNQVN